MAKYGKRIQRCPNFSLNKSRRSGNESWERPFLNMRLTVKHRADRTDPRHLNRCASTPNRSQVVFLKAGWHLAIPSHPCRAVARHPQQRRTNVGRATQPETAIVVAIAGVVVVARTKASINPGIVPGATTHNTPPVLSDRPASQKASDG